NGEWGKPAFQDRWISAVFDFAPEDRRILTLLSGALQTYQSNPYNYYASVKLTTESLEVLLPLLAATNRFFLRPFATPSTLLPLTWESGEPWRFVARILRDSEDYA